MDSIDNITLTGNRKSMTSYKSLILTYGTLSKMDIILLLRIKDGFMVLKPRNSQIEDEKEKHLLASKAKWIISNSL